MKLVSVCRQRNGAKYLPRLTKQLIEISDAVVFLDDWSDDGSYETLVQIASERRNFQVVRQHTRATNNGGSDWNVLYNHVAQFSPEWIFCPDVDELLEESEAKHIRTLIDQSDKTVLGWSFPFYYLWNDEQHYRNDGQYQNTRVIRLYRYSAQHRPPDRAAHATGVPDTLDRNRIRIAKTRMWHFGYMDEADRKAKYDYYKQRDKDPLTAGSGGKSYDHMLNTPAELPLVPSHASWIGSASANGDFLTSAPFRVYIGSPFPDAFAYHNELNDQFKDSTIDEVRAEFSALNLSVDEIKAQLKTIHRQLRPGGRLEVLAVDYTALCKAFVDANDQTRHHLALAHFQRPTATALFEDKLITILNDADFVGVQRVQTPEWPLALLCLAYKEGEPKWI